MTNKLDTLATALYVKTDDRLRASPHQRHGVRPSGSAPQLTDAELVILAMMQAMLGFTSEARWLRHARGHLRRVTRLLAADTSVGSDDVGIVDSTSVECSRSRETVKRADLAGRAEDGYCASHSRFFWGMRLHLACTLQGLPVVFVLTGAKADERG
ncbi:hypothetical protein GCM10010293_50070 [Streptomyces griseoflavus]|nr:hypothetical protein GCM10010293_50070 [Streptomyces griseoflavus]